MMMKFRFLPVLLCFMILIASANCFAAKPDTKESVLTDEYYVKNIGHGEYSLDENKVNSNIIEDDKNTIDVAKIKKIKDDLYQIIDSKTLQEDREYDKLLKVNDEVFLRVKEIEIDLLDSNEVERYISNYDVNPNMAADIRRMSEKAQEPDSSVPKQIMMYTPKKDKTKIETSWTRISGPYYYVGYNGYNYMDEVWYAENRSEMKPVKSGTSTKTYIIQTIKNIGEYLLDTVVEKLYGPEYVVAKLFFPNITDFSPYPANQNDFWNASLIEDKYRKYTSIEVWNNLINDYVYVCRAIGAKASVKFNHYVYYKALMTTPQYKEDKYYTHYTKNYFSLDKKAYARMYDSIPYDENFIHWSPNEYTYFSSIN